MILWAVVSAIALLVMILGVAGMALAVEGGFQRTCQVIRGIGYALLSVDVIVFVLACLSTLGWL